MLAVPKPNGSVTALTGVKFTQFLSENMLVYAGKINIFDSLIQPLTNATALEGFMNTSQMFNPVYARTVPYSTLGAGFAYLQNFEPIATLAVLDTNDSTTTSGFDTFFNNGATLLWQINLPTQFANLPGHQGMSGTYSSGSYTAFQKSPYYDPDTRTIVIPTSRETGSWCLAYNFDQAFYVSPDNPRNKWGVFGNLGVADDNPSPIHWFTSVGLSGSSPLRNRPLDTFGMGYTYTGLSNRVKELAPNLLPLDNEQAVELFYNAGVTPWFHVTPDIQILDPFRKNTNTALLIGLRAKIDF